MKLVINAYLLLTRFLCGHNTFKAILEYVCDSYRSPSLRDQEQ
jgi:hypothetical protein